MTRSVRPSVSRDVSIHASTDEASAEHLADVAYEFHEAATIFPLDEEHLSELAADITAHGLLVPVELLDGKVIDGRRRLKACALAGITPTYRSVTVAEPVAYVLSLNLQRRHLTPSQLSMVAARARSLYDAQAKARKVESGEKHGRGQVVENLPQPIFPDASRARDAAGKVAGVSGKSVDFASRVLTKGTPELVKAVDEGRIAVSTAAVHAADPPDAQRAFVDANANRKYRPTKNGGEFGATTRKETAPIEPAPDTTIRSRGVGVRRANEAVDCLKRIPTNDSLRASGFQIVTDWIRRNR